MIHSKFDGGINSVWNMNTEDIITQKKVKIKEKYFKPVLQLSDIKLSLRQNRSITDPDTEKLYISANGYEPVEVPIEIISQAIYENQDEFFKADIISIEQTVKRLCIERCLFYHPMDELITHINF